MKTRVTEKRKCFKQFSVDYNNLLKNKENMTQREFKQKDKELTKEYENKLQEIEKQYPIEKDIENIVAATQKQMQKKYGIKE